MILSFSLGVGVPIVKVNPQSRIKKIPKVVSVLIFVVLFGCGVAAAQFPPPPRPSPTPPPRPVDGTVKSSDETGPLTTFEEEMRAKRAIKMAEKDHEENLKRAKEIAQIGKDLQANLKDKSVLDRDALKKVERLEKLTKKVRSEAGGEDEDVTIVDRPADLCAAVTQIAEASESLSKNVQDTPRQVVSASVIGKANVLLELIKMARSFIPRP
jgi:hypothetical protein